VLTINCPLVDDSFSVRETCKRRPQTDTAGVRRDDRRFFVLKIRRYLVVFLSCNNIIILSELFTTSACMSVVSIGRRGTLISRCPSAIIHCTGTGVAIRRKICVRVPHLQLAIHITLPHFVERFLRCPSPYRSISVLSPPLLFLHAPSDGVDTLLIL